ncbi:MAG: hypothetical protein M0P17_08385 [Methanoculleus sp.]|nr:hypothetical protein [Methanoculleus sp.]
MDPDRKRLIVVGIFAFVGVILLVATVVLVCTTLVAWISGSSGSPGLSVWEVRGERLGNASIIHLTEKNFEQHPALDSVIRGENRAPLPWDLESTPHDDPDERTIGHAPVTYVERSVLIESFGTDFEAQNRPYLEYDGAYYYLLVSIP